MDIRFQNASGGEWNAACGLVFVCEKDDPSSMTPALWDAQPWMSISPGLREVTGKRYEQNVLYGHPDLAIPRMLFVGLGKKDKLTMAVVRNAIAKAVQYCRDKGYETIGLPVENLERLGGMLGQGRDVMLREAAASALLSLYKLDIYRSSPSDEQGEEEASKADPRWLGFLFTEKETPDAEHRAARRGEAEAAGVILARNLSNGPANHITPEVLAEEARKLAKAHGFACTVLDSEGIRDKGMGALLAVGQGADHPPRFIVLEHCPKGKEQDKPLIIAGKGITFDTGGLSLKPSAKMHEMKGDMGGAAAVLGLFATIGMHPDSDDLPRIVGLIPSAENMPGRKATRPGDIITTLSGKTVEILNTDAEGRLVLCDALAYAQQEWTPAAVIDIATLTGACVIALGDYGTGLFTKDAALRRSIMDAAEKSGDLVWPLPLWEEYDENIKSDFADMTNMGPREGAAINAALYLQRFVNKGTRWAHLDIAGPGYVVKASPLLPVPGGTGMGVRLMCRMLDDGAWCEG